MKNAPVEALKDEAFKEQSVTFLNSRSPSIDIRMHFFYWLLLQEREKKAWN